MPEHCVTPAALVDRIARISAARGGRVIIAIAGAPGSGKSTLATTLAQALDHAAVLPMDGFHLDNDTLAARNLLHRKGAPETFDAAGFDRLLVQVRAGGALSVPTFDRGADKVIPQGGRIAEDVQIVLAEGNYLLLNAPDWSGLRRHFDLTVALPVPMVELERRLIRRWVDHGMSLSQARQRAQRNDLPNARLVMERSVMPDVAIDTGADAAV